MASRHSLPTSPSARTLDQAISLPFARPSPMSTSPSASRANAPSTSPTTFTPRIIHASSNLSPSPSRGNTSSSPPQTQPCAPVLPTVPLPSAASRSRARRRAPSASAPAPQVTPAPAPSAFPLPSYLSHSALRALIRSDPGPEPTLRRAETPSDSEDDNSPPPPPVRSRPADDALRLPTRWSEQYRHHNLSVSLDGRDLSYHGPSSSGDKEAAAARTPLPAPPACGVYYYEIEILSKGTKGHISIGFAQGDVRLSRLPGWERGSWGYHGDDGFSFAAERNGSPYGPTFGTGDIIGCGIDFSQNCAFYTKNGTFLGKVFDLTALPSAQPSTGPGIGISATTTAATTAALAASTPSASSASVALAPLYPSVGLRHAGEAVRANFGHAPFRFDIEEYVREARGRTWARIMEGKQEERRVDIGDLVLGYLSHHGYAKAARAFRTQLARTPAPSRASTDGDVDMDTGASTATTSDEDAAIALRTSIVSAVRAGDIPTALTQLQTHHPAALTHDGGLLTARLRCRQFVELLLARNLETAIALGQGLERDYKGDLRPEVRAVFRRAFGLVAYKDPKDAKGEVGEAVSEGAREVLAEEVNVAILRSEGRPTQPALERLFRQAGACVTQLGVLGVGAAAFADARAELLEDEGVPAADGT